MSENRQMTDGLLRWTRYAAPHLTYLGIGRLHLGARIPLGMSLAPRLDLRRRMIRSYCDTFQDTNDPGHRQDRNRIRQCLHLKKKTS